MHVISTVARYCLQTFLKCHPRFPTVVVEVDPELFRTFFFPYYEGRLWTSGRRDGRVVSFAPVNRSSPSSSLESVGRKGCSSRYSPKVNFTI